MRAFVLAIVPIVAVLTLGAQAARAQASVPVPAHLQERWLNELAPGDGVRRGRVIRPDMDRYRIGLGFAEPPARERPPIYRQAVVGRAAVPAHAIDPAYLPRVVAIRTDHAPGTIIIDTRTRYLYQVRGNGRAMRYGVGIGKPGFSWKGVERVSRKRQWPGWTPPASMIRREAAKGRHLPRHMKGGPNNPLGARALYLGSTLYRIHGTNQPWTIGRAVSSGCIRMRNQDVVELYRTTPVGAKVVVQ